MKQTVEITRILKEKLDKCPNCEGPLEQLGSYTVRCKICRCTYTLQTWKGRLFDICFITGIFSFIVGYLIALFFF